MTGKKEKEVIGGFSCDVDLINELAEQEKNMLLFVVSESCPACDMFKDVMIRVFEEAEGVGVGVIFLDESDVSCIDLVKKYKIRYVPSILVFKNGTLYKKVEPTLDHETDYKIIKKIIDELR